MFLKYFYRYLSLQNAFIATKMRLSLFDCVSEENKYPHPHVNSEKSFFDVSEPQNTHFGRFQGYFEVLLFSRFFSYFLTLCAYKIDIAI